ETAIFTGKGHIQRHTLIDNVYADFRKAEHIGFTCAIVATLYGILEQPVHTIVVDSVVLRFHDTAFSVDAMSASVAALKAKGFDVVSQFSERGCCGRSCQAGTHHDDLVLSLVGRVYQLKIELVFRPLFRYRSFWNFGI